jgi:hypothetical protein
MGDSTARPITWTSHLIDTGGMFSVADPTRITCVRKGLYAVSFSGAFVATSTTGRRVFPAWKNNASILVRQELPRATPSWCRTKAGQLPSWTSATTSS